MEFGGHGFVDFSEGGFDILANALAKKE